MPECHTISDFFAKVISISDKMRDNTWSILKTKAVTHLWVILPGDEVSLINATSDSLTQGLRNRIDVDKIGELIDRPNQDSIYIADWKNRRGQLAHLLRSVDVRLFPIPPNVSLAAVRSFGDDTVKSKLNKKTTPLDGSKSALRASRLCKAILTEAGIDVSTFFGGGKVNSDTVNEFIRIQTFASKDDKRLNKALGSLIEACLAEDAPNLKVISEKKSLPDTNLQPDIQIEIRPGEFICLEPTWRTSGRGILGEVNEAQNTLSEAHVRKYILEKATQYVKAMGL